MDRGRAPNGIGHLMILLMVISGLHHDRTYWFVDKQHRG